MGGLTTACLLAKSGQKVLVLEKNDYPGGYCSVFKRGQYKFESAIHAINGLGSNGRTRAVLEKCGIFHKLTLLEPTELLRIIFPNQDLIIPQRNTGAFKKILINLFPSESNGISSVFGEAKKIFEESHKTVSDRKYSMDEVSLTWKYRDTTLKDFLDSYIKDSKLKAIFSQYWGYLGVPPDQISSIYYLYMFWDYVANGAYYIEGGSEVVAKLLAEEIKKCGSEILFNKEVIKLNSLDKFTASYVTTTDDKAYYAKNFVSNISAKRIFLEMADDLTIPDQFINRIKKRNQSASAFVFYIGLKKNIREMGICEYEIFINPDYDVNRHYNASMINDMQSVQLGITIYSNLDQTVCASNRSVLSIFILSEYDSWKTQSAEEYSAKKKEFTDIILNRCDQLIPGFTKNIDHIETATPLTLEKYSGNFKGALYGWNQDISFTGFRRQRVTTPISNLFLTGAWTRPGGGFSSAVYSGSLTADAMIYNRAEDEIIA